jgi:Protein of unknown function (DUF2934)
MRTRKAHISVPKHGHTEKRPIERFPVPAPAAAAALVTCDEIRHLAYQKWEAAGQPFCDGVQFWLEAESELLHHDGSVANA